jgi:hypothetical protein
MSGNTTEQLANRSMQGNWNHRIRTKAIVAPNRRLNLYNALFSDWRSELPADPPILTIVALLAIFFENLSRKLPCQFYGLPAGQLFATI